MSEIHFIKCRAFSEENGDTIGNPSNMSCELCLQQYARYMKLRREGKSEYDAIQIAFFGDKDANV